MDIKRPPKSRLKKKIRTVILIVVGLVATINSQYSQAKLQLDADEVLAKQGLVADLVLKISRSRILPTG